MNCHIRACSTGESILEHISYSPKEKALLVVVDARMIVKYGFMLVVYFFET